MANLQTRTRRVASKLKRKLHWRLFNDNISQEYADRLLFRYGFLCHAAKEPLDGDETWQKLRRFWSQVRIGEFIIYLHPETRLEQGSNGDKHIVLIGDAFVASGADSDPLSLVLSATDEELLDLLDRLSGRFALLVLHGDRGKVFHDALGARTIFYKNDGRFALSSHAELLSHASRIGPSKKMQAFVASSSFNDMKMKALPGDETMYEGVHGLPPNLYYDIGQRRTVRYWPRRARRESSFDELFSLLDRYFRELVDFVASPKRPVVSITGGIDSRTILSAFLYYGVDLKTVTWTILSFKDWEIEPVNEIVRYIGVPHALVDKNNSKINNVSFIGLRNSGNFRSPSHMVSGMYRLYGHDPHAIFVRGHGSGTIRGSINANKKLMPMQSSSVDEMVRIFMCQMWGRGDTPDSNFYQAAYNSFQGFRERADYDNLSVDDLGLDINDIFNMEYRSLWGGASLNEVDPALNSIFGFNNRLLWECAYGLPPSERLTKNLFLRVIERYDKNLAKIYYR